MKKEKKKPQLVKISNIDCVNGNAIKIGQYKRYDESEPTVWEYEVTSPTGKTLSIGQNSNRHAAFQEALKIATTNC